MLRHTLTAVLSVALVHCTGSNNATDANPILAADQANEVIDSSDSGTMDVFSSDVLDVDTGIPDDTGPTDSGGPLPCSRPTRRSASEFPVFPGPSAPIQVIRDNLGIPHIYGQNDLDVLFGSGYVQAVDRLFQMELMKRSAQGRIAQVIGREKLSQDELVRRINIPRLAQLSTDQLRRDSPQAFDMLVAWTAGVNRRIREVRSQTVPLPPGFRPSEYDFLPEEWTPDDAVSVGRLILFQNANQIEFDLLSTIIQNYVPAAQNVPLFQSLTDSFVLPPEDRPINRPSMASSPNPRTSDSFSGILPRDINERMREFTHTLGQFRSGGSNNWAVDGRFTDNGRPLIAGDPHQGLMSPSVMWAQHMNSADAGGTLDVIGWSFVGAPAVQLGHNRHVVWTATTTYPDMMDMWEVRSAGSSIVLGGQNYPVEQCTESIEVRGQDAVSVTFEDVPGQGLLLPRMITPLPVTRAGYRLLFNWTGFRATNEARAFLDMDRATNRAEFDAALTRMETAAFNFVFADAQGIQYRLYVLLPDRGDPSTLPVPNRVLDGANPRTLWTGTFLSADRLPHSTAATRGFLSSANNDPYGFTANGQVADDPLYYGVWFDPGSRANRIESELSRLTTAGNVTRAQMQALQQDTYNVYAERLLPVLFEAFDAIGTNPSLASFQGNADIAQLVGNLRGWDRRMERNSSEAVIYEGWQHFYARLVLADDMSIAFEPVLSAEPTYILKLLEQVINNRFPNARQYAQEGHLLLALRALSETRDWLQTRFGGIALSNYRWDQYHRTRFGTMFSNAGPFATNTVSTRGSIGTVNVSQARFFNGTNINEFHTSGSGAVYRLVAGFAADGTPEADVNFARGNSGDPTSANFNNTETDWVEGNYRRLPFRRTDVMSAQQEQFTINP